MVEMALPSDNVEAGDVDEQIEHIELLNRRAKRLSKRDKQRLLESSDSAVSPTFDFAKLDRKLNKRDGSRTMYTQVVRWGCVFGALGWQSQSYQQGVYSAGGDSTKKVFTAMANGGWSASFLLCPLLIDYFRRVIRPGEHLDCLGAGRTRISARVERNLKRWQKWLRVPKFVFRVFGGFMVFFMLTMVAFIPMMAKAGKLHMMAVWMGTFLCAGIWSGMALPLVLDWWISLKVASALAADSTAEVLGAAEKVSPKDKGWESKVVEPAKKLALDTMDELTHGWGRALVVAYGIFWFFSVAFFAFLLNATGNDLKMQIMKTLMGTLCAAGMLSPIAMSLDPANVSTSCDELLTELNARRCELLGDDAAINKIMQLEDYLNTLNNRQGLGFVSNGTVLDKKKLRTMLSIVFGVFATVVPFMLALYSAATADAAVYGRMTNSTKIYAYSPQQRTFPEAEKFCESLWMKPVSIHSTAEMYAVVQLVDTIQSEIFVGGVPACDNKDKEPKDFEYEWVDGSPWDFEPPWQEGEPNGAGPVAFFYDPDGVGLNFKDKSSLSAQLPVVCAAGAIPTILHLGGPKAEWVFDNPSVKDMQCRAKKKTP